jgi:heptosyltransferase-2
LLKNAYLSVKKEYAELVATNPHLNRIYEIDTAHGFEELKKIKKELKAAKYDVMVDIHNNFRSRYLRLGLGARVVSINKRVVKRFLLVKFKVNRYQRIVPVAERYLETVALLGVCNDGLGLEMFVPEEIVTQTHRKLENVCVRKSNVVGFCPGAKHKTKMWLTEYWIALGNKLQEKYQTMIVLFGGNEDRTQCGEIARHLKGYSFNVAGELSLLETAAAMDMCDVVVTNDTGLMHIAAARKRRIVALFGPTVQEFGFFPYGTESIVMERKDLPCRPCTHIGLAECPQKHFKCMKEIIPDDVMQQVAELLQSSSFNTMEIRSQKSE